MMIGKDERSEGMMDKQTALFCSTLPKKVS
jgi:hypothetical protein